MSQLKKYTWCQALTLLIQVKVFDYGNATSHPVADPTQTSSWHHCISCWSNSAGPPQPSPPTREQLSAPSSCQSLHSLWLEKNTFQAGQLNEDTAQAQTDAHTALTARTQKPQGCVCT